MKIVQIRSRVEFPEEDRAIVDLRVEVFGRTGGTLTRGLTDSSPLGEKYTLYLRKEDGKWKITAVDPENRRWPRP